MIRLRTTGKRIPDSDIIPCYLSSPPRLGISTRVRRDPFETPGGTTGGYDGVNARGGRDVEPAVYLGTRGVGDE